MTYSTLKQQELENQVHLLSKFFDETQSLSKIGSWNWDILTNEVHWSDMMFILLGLEPNVLKPSYELALNHVHVDDKDEYEKTLEIALNNKTPYYFENCISKKDGSVIHVISRGECILDEKGDLLRMIGTVQDISERKELEKLSYEKIASEERDRIKSIFLSIISHDLKSPFNSLNYLSDYLIDEIGNRDYGKSLEYASHIKSITKQSYELLTNLLDWSMSQTDQISFNPETKNFAALLEEQIHAFIYLSLQKKVNLTSTVESNIEVLCDENMVATIMRNLLTNALKYSNIGGEITVNATKNGNHTTISVADNGIGIHTKVLKNLFKLDKITNTQGTANERGTGLGLTLCKEFVERHGGEIWVESEEGKGSVFYFTLPSK